MKFCRSLFFFMISDIKENFYSAVALRAERLFSKIFRGISQIQGYSGNCHVDIYPGIR